MKSSGLHKLTGLQSFEWRLDSSLLSLKQHSQHSQKNSDVSASLIMQWIRICLPMQGPWVQSLVREYSSCLGAAKPMCHNYWAHAAATEARVTKPVLCKRRSQHREKTDRCKWSGAPALHTWRKPRCSSKDPVQYKYIHKEMVVCVVRSKAKGSPVEIKEVCRTTLNLSLLLSTLPWNKLHSVIQLTMV